MTPLEELGPFDRVPVTVEVALDCGSLPLGEISEWDEGSVIRSARPAGDNLEIRIGGRVVGSGEIVMIEGAVGVRITSLREND